MAIETQEMVCITCPLGCRMTLDIEDGAITAVRHNACKRGAEYAQQEFADPRRMVTGTAAIAHGVVTRVPVRTTNPLPIDKIEHLLQAMYALRLSAPLESGTVVIQNVADTGIDLITTRSVLQTT